MSVIAVRFRSSGRMCGWIACTVRRRRAPSCANWIFPPAMSRLMPRSRRKTDKIAPMNRKLRFGMIGGGRGAFIGAVHRLAAIMDSKAELVAGAFSSDAVRSKASGKDLNLDATRVYESYEAMALAEAKRPADQRLDFVAIVTP